MTGTTSPNPTVVRVTVLNSNSLATLHFLRFSVSAVHGRTARGRDCATASCAAAMATSATWTTVASTSCQRLGDAPRPERSAVAGRCRRGGVAGIARLEEHPERSIRPCRGAVSTGPCSVPMDAVGPSSRLRSEPMASTIGGCPGRDLEDSQPPVSAFGATHRRGHGEARRTTVPGRVSDVICARPSRAHWLTR